MEADASDRDLPPMPAEPVDELICGEPCSFAPAEPVLQCPRVEGRGEIRGSKKHTSGAENNTPPSFNVRVLLGRVDACKRLMYLTIGQELTEEMGYESCPLIRPHHLGFERRGQAHLGRNVCDENAEGGGGQFSRGTVPWNQPSIPAAGIHNSTIQHKTVKGTLEECARKIHVEL